MANFGILRIQKLKSPASVRASLKHALREQPTMNANSELTVNNSRMYSSSVDEAMELFNARLATQKRIRSDAVHCVEFVITGSPEAIIQKSIQEQDAYFNDAMKWLENKHGKENIIFAGVHRDETTPHLTAFIVPINDKQKLSCKSFYGGTKYVLSDLQTEFTEKVAKYHDLERGLLGSKAHHVDIKTYYRRVNRPNSFKANISEQDIKPEVIHQSFFSKKCEPLHVVAARLNQKIEQEVKSLMNADFDDAEKYRKNKGFYEEIDKLGMKFDFSLALVRKMQDLKIEADRKAKELALRRQLEKEKKLDTELDKPKIKRSFRH